MYKFKIKSLKSGFTVNNLFSVKDKNLQIVGLFQHELK